MPPALVMPPGTGPSAGPGGGLDASHLPMDLMGSPELPTTAAGPDPTVWGILSVADPWGAPQEQERAHPML